MTLEVPQCFCYNGDYEVISFQCSCYHGDLFNPLVSGTLYFGNEPEKNTIVRLGLGGRGGGALKVVARHVFIDGKLSANGENGDIHAGE